MVTAKAGQSRGAQKLLKRIMKKYPGLRAASSPMKLRGVPRRVKEIGVSADPAGGRPSARQSGGEFASAVSATRARAMLRFRSREDAAEIELSSRPGAQPNCNQERHLVTRQVYKQRRSVCAGRVARPSRRRSPLARWRSPCMSTSLRYLDTAAPEGAASLKALAASALARSMRHQPCCSTSARIVVRLRLSFHQSHRMRSAGSTAAGQRLLLLHPNDACPAAPHNGPNRSTYDGPGDGAARCPSQSTVVISRNYRTKWQGWSYLQGQTACRKSHFAENSLFTDTVCSKGRAKISLRSNWRSATPGVSAAPTHEPAIFRPLYFAAV